MLSMLARSKWLVEAIIIGCQSDCNITLADHVLQSKKYTFNGRFSQFRPFFIMRSVTEEAINCSARQICTYYWRLETIKSMALASI